MTLSRPSGRSFPLLVASTLVVGLGSLPVLDGPAAASSPREVPSAAPPDVADGVAWEYSTVTLVTGDKVTLGQAAGHQPTVAFEPRRGPRAGAVSDFSVRRDDGGVTVIPTDVAGLVPSVLDPALFDVTGLVEMGYDDATTDTLPLIVERAAGVRTLAAASDALEPEHVLSSIHATAVTLDKGLALDFGLELNQVDELRGPVAVRELGGLSQVSLDRQVTASALDAYLNQIKAQPAFDSGLDGAGVKVAVLDTGVDAAHPTLDGQVDDQANFTDGSSTVDGNGHGTHVASLVAGTGALSDGARRGIAPGVGLISGKVLADDGFGQESWVIEGMEWAVAQGADVVNLSLGGPAGTTDDSLVQALDTLTAQSGTLFVVAAGNRGGFGGNPFTIDSPGTAASALTVGAVTSSDSLAVFSSEGPTRGSYRAKPDIAAPGVNIPGARAGTHTGNVYVGMSGTSQATPLVAGSAALVMQAHPDWTWQQVKTELVGTADPAQFQTTYTHGSGRLDLTQATTQFVTADRSSFDYGYLRHPDEAVRTRTLTLTNDGAAPVDVTITDQEQLDGGGIFNPGGEVFAPEGALTASPSTLTIPAGGEAQTVVTLDPALFDDGLWQGKVTFSSEGTSLLNLPVGLYDEPARYDVDVRVIDRNGDPYAGGSVQLQDGVKNLFHNIQLDENGRGTARIAPGHYSAFSRVVTPAGTAPSQTFTIAGMAEVPITEDTSITIDARKAERLRAPDVHHASTRVVHASLSYARHSETGGGYIDFAGFSPADINAGRIFITPTKPVRHGSFEAALRWRLERTGFVSPGQPSAYELLRTAPRFTSPLSPALTKRDVDDLARVEDMFGAMSRSASTLAGRAWMTDESGIALISYRQVDIPSKQVELVTAAPDVMWYQCLFLPSEQIQASRLCHPETQIYARGEDTKSRWSAGLHPDVVDSFHNSSTMFFDTALSDGPHLGRVDGHAVDSSSLTLYRDGEQVAVRDGTFGFFPVPDGPGSFRLDQRWALDPEVFPVSQQAQTSWTFRSEPPDDPTQQSATTPPLLQLWYDVEVDGLGKASTRGPLPVTLRVGHLAGADDPSKITGAQLEVSTNGGSTWSAVSLKRAGNGAYRGAVPKHKLVPGGSLSFRTQATDQSGGTVDQTVLGMIPVR